ncbi:MAG: hypothetical protein ACI3XA_08855 [Clostridia bacterium]
MRITDARRDRNSILLILAFVFTTGVVLGSVAFLCMDKDILNAINVGINTNFHDTDFMTTYKESFMVEILWAGLAFLIGQIGFLVPLSSSVLAVRGFVLGFTVSFVFATSDNCFKILLKTIVPQCLFGIPLLTFITVFNILCFLENKRGKSTYWSCVWLSAVTFFGAALVALAQTAATRFL